MSNNLDTTIKISEVFCEFLEVIIHNILYIRKLYPESIFLPKRKYGILVYQSIHPQLNEYIRDCLKAVNFHSKSQQLKKCVLCISTNNSIIEKYVIDILSIRIKLEDVNFHLKLEASLRAFCLKLRTKASYLDNLPEDASFCIHLHTTEVAEDEFNKNPTFEDFPWVRVSIKESEIPHGNIIPLYSVDTEALKLQLYVERCCID